MNLIGYISKTSLASDYGRLHFSIYNILMNYGAFFIIDNSTSFPISLSINSTPSGIRIC